jgi:hypothetical protein
MKTNTVANDDVLVHGARQTRKFSIAANGKAFKILIDGIYSNKIQAIVREISSNAFDAHIGANRSETPFDIQLPNLLDPSFSVRDYGTSLSHEDIMGLYTTLFESTKEDSNDEIGKFGLGSKTPFAYTDNFTVTAFLRGTKRVYAAYIDVKGEPNISLMASEDTDEHDGLMVSFPVNSKDCERFRVECEKVVEGFDIKPNIRGAKISLKRHGETIKEGSNFKVYPNGGARAKQGCVIYPIDLDALPSLTQQQKNILTSDILIDFPIGELDITPSREMLSYDDITIQNILDMAEKIDAEILGDMEQQYSKMRTMHEARCFMTRHKNAALKTISNFATNLRFNGKTVSSHSNMQRDKLKKIYGASIYNVDGYDIRNLKTLKYKGDKGYVTSWDVDEGTMFLVEDYRDPNKAVKLVNARIRNNLGDHTNIVWIRDYGMTDKQFRQLRKLLGYPPKFYKLSDFQLPVREKTVRSYNYDPVPRIARHEIRAEKVNSSNQTYEYIFDLNNLSQDTKYLFFYKGYFLSNEADADSGVVNINNYFTKEELDSFIVVRNKHLEKIKKLGFTNALTEKRDALEQILDFQAFNARAELDKEMNHWIKKYANDLSALEYDSDTSFKKVLDFLRRYANNDESDTNSANIALWKRLVPLSVYVAKKDEFPVEFTGADTLSYWVDKFKADYPLVNLYLPTYTSSEFYKNLEHIFNYIKMVDKENGQNIIT